MADLASKIKANDASLGSHSEELYSQNIQRAKCIKPIVFNSCSYCYEGFGTKSMVQLLVMTLCDERRLSWLINTIRLVPSTDS